MDTDASYYIADFSQYLRGCVDRPDAVGDFARDWMLDDSNHQPWKVAFGRQIPSRPVGEADLDAIISYLEDLGASENAMDAARAAWAEFTGQ